MELKDQVRGLHVEEKSGKEGHGGGGGSRERKWTMSKGQGNSNKGHYDWDVS